MSVSARPCSSPAELRRSLDIYNAVWPHRAVTVEDVEAWKRAALASAEFLGAVEGADVGSAAVSFEASRTNLASTLVTVLAQHRRVGVGSALLDAVSKWAAGQGARELETRVEADDDESMRFALRRGFHEHSRELGLELRLRDVVPPSVDPPAGVEIVLLADRRDLAAGVYDVAAQALPDVPGSEDWLPPPFERFVAGHLRGLAIFVAVADGKVIGYAKLVARPDGRTADHGITAVKREWRNRGVARALKRAQIAWATANGIERLTAANEERNTPIQRINASLGYRMVPGRVRFRAPLG
jgi:mycothiol synthase